MLAYGQFVTLSINFLIVAFILFMVVKAMNRHEAQGRGQAAGGLQGPARGKARWKKSATSSQKALGRDTAGLTRGACSALPRTRWRIAPGALGI